MAIKYNPDAPRSGRIIRATDRARELPAYARVELTIRLRSTRKLFLVRSPVANAFRDPD